MIFVGIVCALLVAPTTHGQQFGKALKAGDPAPDFELKTLDDKSVRASALWSNQPTVIMTGSYTCPVFRGKTSGFEKLAREFSHQVNFLVVYTLEAHPKGDPSPYHGRERITRANERARILVPQPKTAEERTQRAQTCAREMKLATPVVVDQMDDAVWKAYGSAPNSATLVGRDGKVLEYEKWFEPQTMRVAITKALK